jgi:transposase
MDIVIARAAGLDVHQKSVMASVRIQEPDGRVRKDTLSFGTTVKELRRLRDWLVAYGVTHAAIESTGVLWKPVWHVLESHVELLLVNPRDVKRMPGRKTDVKDAEWLAQLLQAGLLSSSFVPPRDQRELRDLTRHRASLEQQRTAVANRVHKLLEDANIKLGAVASDILGVSGRLMLRAMADGETDPHRLADFAQRRLREKLPALRDALTGDLTPHHRFMLQRLLEQLAYLEEEVATFDRRIEACTVPFTAVITRLDSIPGVNRRTAENLLAEIGPNMAIFPDAKHLASWAAICPGHDRSAGKQRRGTIRKGNRWLRRTLGQAAWAARNKKNSYLAAQFWRLAGRRGRKRAIVAVSHSILVAAYYIIRDGVTYHDLGADHFDRLAPQQLTRHLVKRLEQLGHKVTLEVAA